MAIDLVNGVGGTIYERSANLPTGDHTQCCWAYLVTGNPGLSCIVSRVNATSSPTEYELVGFDNGTNPMTLFSATGQSAIRTLNTGQWFFAAMRNDSTTLYGYTRYATETAFTTVNRTRNAQTPVRMSLGTDYFGDPVPDLRVAAWMTWDRALSEAELLHQSYYGIPLSYTNLNTYHPFWSPTLDDDFSPNGRTATQGGAAGALADGPPILWKRSRRRTSMDSGTAPPGASPGSSKADAIFSRRRRRNGGMDWYLTANEWW